MASICSCMPTCFESMCRMAASHRSRCVSSRTSRGRTTKISVTLRHVRTFSTTGSNLKIRPRYCASLLRSKSRQFSLPGTACAISRPISIRGVSRTRSPIRASSASYCASTRCYTRNFPIFLASSRLPYGFTERPRRRRAPRHRLAYAQECELVRSDSRSW